jgi:hypothetical protein
MNSNSSNSSNTTSTIRSSNIFLLRTFHYEPNVDAALSMSVIFAVLTVAFIAQTGVYGGWRFMGYAVLASVLQVLGYALRAACAQTPELILYIISTFFILVSPIALALVNYIVVAILLEATGKTVWAFREWNAKSVGKIFFRSDLACLFLQASAGGLFAIGNPAMIMAATAIVLTGLIIQLLFFAVFTWILYKLATLDQYKLNHIQVLKPVWMGLWSTITCLYVRNIYRVVEYSARGTDAASPIITNEWVFYVFDTTPIVISCVLYNIYHFGRLLEMKNGGDASEWMMHIKKEGVI